MNSYTTQSYQLHRESGFSSDHKFRRLKMEEDFRRINHKKFQSLTKREVEILVLIVNDFNNPQIAQKLFISRLTVEQHRKNINRKLEINTPFQLFQYALAFDLY